MKQTKPIPERLPWQIVDGNWVAKRYHYHIRLFQHPDGSWDAEIDHRPAQHGDHPYVENVVVTDHHFPTADDAKTAVWQMLQQPPRPRFWTNKQIEQDLIEQGKRMAAKLSAVG